MLRENEPAIIKMISAKEQTSMTAFDDLNLEDILPVRKESVPPAASGINGMSKVAAKA